MHAINRKLGEKVDEEALFTDGCGFYLGLDDDV